MSNEIRMSFVEWLYRMSRSKLTIHARMVAVHAACYDVTGNRELGELCGIKDDRTIRSCKATLVSGGWVIILRPGGGRGNGVKVCAALRGIPVDFTDVKPQNPDRLCTRLDRETPASNAPHPVQNPNMECLPSDAETPASDVPLCRETPAIAAGVSAPRAPARAYKELPSEVVISRVYPTTTVEQEAPRGGGSFDPDFSGLNGTAVEMIAFIGKHALVDDRGARHMLKTNIQAFGLDAMLEAYSVTIAEMAGRGVAAPYKFLMGCARNAKERKAQQPKAGPKEGSTARTMRIARMLESQNGGQS